MDRTAETEGSMVFTELQEVGFNLEVQDRALRLHHSGGWPRGDRVPGLTVRARCCCRVYGVKVSVVR